MFNKSSAIVITAETWKRLDCTPPDYWSPIALLLLMLMLMLHLLPYRQAHGHHLLRPAHTSANLLARHHHLHRCQYRTGSPGCRGRGAWIDRGHRSAGCWTTSASVSIHARCRTCSGE